MKTETIKTRNIQTYSTKNLKSYDEIKFHIQNPTYKKILYYRIEQ